MMNAWGDVIAPPPLHAKGAFAHSSPFEDDPATSYSPRLGTRTVGYDAGHDVAPNPMRPRRGSHAAGLMDADPLDASSPRSARSGDFKVFGNAMFAEEDNSMQQSSTPRCRLGTSTTTSRGGGVVTSQVTHNSFVGDNEMGSSPGGNHGGGFRTKPGRASNNAPERAGTSVHFDSDPRRNSAFNSTGGGGGAAARPSGMNSSIRSELNSTGGGGARGLNSSIRSELNATATSDRLNSTLNSTGRSFNRDLNNSLGSRSGRERSSPASNEQISLAHSGSIGRSTGASAKTGVEHLQDEEQALEESGKPKSRLSNFFRRKKKAAGVEEVPPPPMAGSVRDAGTKVCAFVEDDDDDTMSVLRQKSVSKQRSMGRSTGGGGLGPAGRSTGAIWEEETMQMMASGPEQKAEAMLRAGPADDYVRCYVVRKKQMLGAYSTLEMYLENDDTFLMAARRRKKTQSSSYVLSVDLDNLKRESEECTGKLKASGWEYLLWAKSEDEEQKKGYSTQSMVISLKSLQKGAAPSGPRGMQVIMPLPESDWQPSTLEGDDCLTKLLAAGKSKTLSPEMEANLVFMTSKQPEYDHEAGGYVLDFHGRVTETSVKNFQLVAWNHNTGQTGNTPLVLFGKKGKDVYALDFRYPMSAQTAFSAALASIDSKLCCSV
ncbi:hypothetical protein FOA52_014430 [Chlamydomonas sp. UWO 241]|nr:hypothetical protein FOA52_014430 [Chlamydomonas sp. UWO 241]